jgi:hypothetical protein
MSTEENSRPTIAKTSSSPLANGALWLGLFILFIVVVNVLLPRSWADVISISLMISGTLFVVGMTTQVWLARRRAGQILRNLGLAEQTASAQMALLLAMAALTLVNYFTHSPQDAYRLARGVAFSSLAASMLLANRQATLITVKGWYKFDAVVPWDNINRVEWEAVRNGYAVVALYFKRKRWWSASARFRVPAADMAAVEALLSQHGVAQHGVQPTLPSCAS